MKEKQIGKNEIQKKDSREFWKKQKKLFLFLTVSCAYRSQSDDSFCCRSKRCDSKWI